jgi:septal ring-binding cell division protein DamX
MFRLFRFTLLAACVSLSATASAQMRVSPTDSAVYARARQLVAAGNGAAGRVLVDSMVTVTAPDTPAFAEALYWRATLAADSEDAERDYRRIVVDYALSSRAGDALLQLAQLELARGDRMAARTHLERFLLESPDHADRGRAGLSLVRLSFDAGDAQRACITLGRTLREVPESSVELRNQLSYFTARCASVDTTRRVVAVTPDTATTRTDTTKRDTAKRDTAKRDAVKRDSAKAAPKPTGKYTIQVAAYSSRELADALVKRLTAKGLEARTVGTKSPYRVRIGHYKTRAAATAAANKLKAQKIEARVIEIGAEEG